VRRHQDAALSVPTSAGQNRDQFKRLGVLTGRKKTYLLEVEGTPNRSISSYDVGAEDSLSNKAKVNAQLF
jgi:hypothetical protein